MKNHPIKNGVGSSLPKWNFGLSTLFEPAAVALRRLPEFTLMGGIFCWLPRLRLSSPPPNSAARRADVSSPQPQQSQPQQSWACTGDEASRTSSSKKWEWMLEGI